MLINFHLLFSPVVVVVFLQRTRYGFFLAYAVADEFSAIRFFCAMTQLSLRAAGEPLSAPVSLLVYLSF